MGRNAKLLYWDGDPKECDMCDQNEECASIQDLLGHVMIICHKCLESILKQRNE